MYRKKSISIYYCNVCGTEFGEDKPISDCTHEVWSTCGFCKHYDVAVGVCHINPYDDCADRDSHHSCNIDRFEAKE